MVGTRATSAFVPGPRPRVSLAVSPPRGKPARKGSTRTSSSEPQTSELYTGWYPSPAQRHRRTYAECAASAAPPGSIRGGGNATKKSATTRPVSRGDGGGWKSGAAAKISNPMGPLSSWSTNGGVAAVFLNEDPRRLKGEIDDPVSFVASFVSFPASIAFRAGFRVNA